MKEAREINPKLEVFKTSALSGEGLDGLCAFLGKSSKSSEAKVHELSIVADLFTIIEEKAREAGASRVTRVRVLIGELSGVVPELFRTAFHSYKKGTMADQARLEIKVTRVKFRCLSCGKEIKTKDISSPIFLFLPLLRLERGRTNKWSRPLPGKTGT